jgi:hypothetical protein
MAEQLEYPEELYVYDDLPTEDSFRVLELLPGTRSDPTCCLLHVIDRDNPKVYEAISYTWGDPNITAPVNVGDKRIDITLNLYGALQHFRYQTESRFLWADSIWYADIPSITQGRKKKPNAS